MITITKIITYKIITSYKPNQENNALTQRDVQYMLNYNN